MPVTIEYNYQDINCNLNISANVIEMPNINSPNNGKIKIVINNGKPPYFIHCTNQLTNESNPEKTTNLKNHIFFKSERKQLYHFGCG